MRPKIGSGTVIQTIELAKEMPFRIRTNIMNHENKLARTVDPLRLEVF